MPGELELALSIIDQTLPHFPNFSQRRKKEYMKVRKEIRDEKAKPRIRRSDRLLSELRAKRKDILTIWKKELGQ